MKRREFLKSHGGRSGDCHDAVEPDVNRRGFLKAALAAAALALAPAWSASGRLLPGRWVEAVRPRYEALRARFYPGPVRRRLAHITKPGKWAG